MKRLKSVTVIGILFVIITGSLAHFLYDWTGNNPIIGFFTPVNESLWEHMKLVFFPMLLYSLPMILIFRKEFPCILSSLWLGNLTGSLLIPVFYYAYTGVLGRDIFLFDIAIFIVSVLIAFRLSYKYALSCRLQPYTVFLTGMVCILFICFLVFTYRPPAMNLFEDPTKRPSFNEFDMPSSMTL